MVTTHKSSLAQGKSNPEGGAASQKTKGTKKGEKKTNPSLSLLKEERVGEGNNKMLLLRL